VGFWRRRKARRTAETPAQSWARRKAELRRRRDARAAAWRVAELTVERIQAEYDERTALLDEPLRPFARPIAAWSLRDGEPRVTSSHMGGRPALYPAEEWPGGADDPMRFWAQLNLAELAPYAQAFGTELPSSGLVQLFAGDEGGEYARYIPASDHDRLELRGEIPISHLWTGSDDAERIHRRSQLIDLYPEALVPWQEAGDLLPDDGYETCTTSEVLPGYSFGWWPFSSWSLEDGVFGWPETRPRPRPEDWVFLAVCDSNDDLGLAYSDAGFLWAMAPSDDLAAGSFEQLRCDGESS
jgi:Domain of unknown function (DUF1963)